MQVKANIDFFNDNDTIGRVFSFQNHEKINKSKVFS